MESANAQQVRPWTVLAGRAAVSAAAFSPLIRRRYSQARSGKPCAARQRRRLRNSRTAPSLGDVIDAYKLCHW